MRRAILFNVHSISVDLGFWTRLDAVGGLCLLALERLLGWGLLNGAVRFGRELVGGNALIEGQEAAIARVGPAMIRAKPVSWRRVTSLGAQLIEAHAVLYKADKGMGLDVGGEWERVRVADPASREVEGSVTEASFLKVSPYKIVDRVAAQSLRHGALCERCMRLGLGGLGGVVVMLG
jgi:hypothetical protein